VQEAIEFAAGKLGADLSQRRLCNGTAKAASSDALAAKRNEYQKLRQGESAPQAIITCIEAATKSDFLDGMKTEGTEFIKLMRGDQSKALQYMFFAERTCAKIPGLDAAPGPLNAAGIVGAGLMGGGIAMCCAEAGMNVILLDVDQKNLDRGMSVIRKNYQRSVDRKSKSQAQVDKIMARITPSTSYDSLAECDIVVEAVFENMDLKKKIFASFDKVCKPGCILASNTSRLNIDAIAGATQRPQDVIGCHFFSPANVMKLLENVRGPRTAPRTIATAMAFGKKLKKITCLVGNCDGFIANRVMGVSGAVGLIQDGLMPHQIDGAAEAYGMKMGPFRMNDLVGLDLFGRERAQSGAAQPDKVIFDAMYKLERFGQKNGKGFYKYDDKLRCSRDPDAEAVIQQVWKNNGTQPKNKSQEEIVDLMYLPVVNEGFKCLEEGMAIRPSDIDVCCHFGYNWPRYRGGPMQWATAVGLPTVLKKIEALGLKPSELLKECVKNDWKLSSKGFTDRIAAAWSAQWSKSKL
jgi:3-hydroxyacyl-CoA dehydrogenase